MPYAYGFSFYNNKKKLTISGDTRPCESLMQNAQNSDVLLHEVFIEYEMNKTSKLRTKKHYIMSKSIILQVILWVKLQNYQIVKYLY